uniref:Uncharacterized protein n=1 Tax=Clastoptera arizonana TaxID=38151 RepID=A0A1B6CIG7_9HEMI
MVLIRHLNIIAYSVIHWVTIKLYWSTCHQRITISSFLETKEKTFEECVCLSHVHVSVCQVLPYQEKGLIEAKKQNMWKNSVSGSPIITNKIDHKNQLYNRVSVQITNRPETSSNQMKRLNPVYKQIDANKRIKLINGAAFNTSQAHEKSAQRANLNANHFQGQGLQKTFNSASGSQNVSSINNHNFVFKKINPTNPNSGNNIEIVHQQGESIQIKCPILNQNFTSSQIISSRATKIVVQNNQTNTSHISSEMHLPLNTNKNSSFINMFESNRSQASSGIALPFQANQNPHFINMVQTSISQTSLRNPMQFQTNRISSFLFTSQTNKSQTSPRIPTQFQANQSPSFINNNRFQSSHRAVLPFQISQAPSFLNIVQNNTTQTTPRMSFPLQINLNSSNTSSVFNNLSKPQ